MKNLNRHRIKTFSPLLKNRVIKRTFIKTVQFITSGKFQK